MIFLDLARSQACLAAGLIRELLPDPHRTHRLLSISRNFNKLRVLCECGETLFLGSTQEISHILSANMQALDTDPYPLDKERLCLAVHAQHPFHVPVIASDDGSVRCSCGAALHIPNELVYEEPEIDDEVALPTLELTQEDHDTLCFYAHAQNSLPPVNRAAEIKRWWVSEGLSGSVVRLDTDKGMEDIEDPLLISLALKHPTAGNKPIWYPEGIREIVKLFKDLKLHHHYHHHIAQIAAAPTNKLYISCSCGVKAKRLSKKMVALVQRLAAD